MGSVIEWSIHQIYKIFFICLKMSIMQWRKNIRIEKDKKNNEYKLNT